jgi:hypothetical protein
VSHGASHAVPGIPAADKKDRVHDKCNREPELPVLAGLPAARPLPDEASALKVLYLVIAAPQKNRTNVNGATPGWKEAINALTMCYGDRITLN